MYQRNLLQNQKFVIKLDYLFWVEQFSHLLGVKYIVVFKEKNNNEIEPKVYVHGNVRNEDVKHRIWPGC